MTVFQLPVGYVQSVEMLLREVETAPSSVELEMAGKVLVDRIHKTRATASQIRDEEMTEVVQERDQAVEKVCVVYSVNEPSEVSPI